MSYLNKYVVLFLFIISNSIYCELTRIDTILISNYQEKYKLKNNFILDNKLNIIAGNKIFKVDSIDRVNGVIFFKNNFTEKIFATVEYKILSNGLPITIKKYEDYLEPLTLIKKKDTSYKFYQDKNSDKTYEISSYGSFNRKLSYSPIIGNQFSGNINIELDGMLSDDISISANISDNDFPIQPEGTTRNLEDLQQVYIELNHPQFSVNVGDVNYNYKKNGLLDLDRILVGVKNNIKFDNINFSSIYANSKGKYNSMEIIGEDGIQGPYRLLSSSNELGVTILAGSENIWLNGKKMIRGVDNDYIIDYYNADINFTPNIIIDDNSYILIEFQYIDEQFNNNLIGGAFDYKSNISSIKGGFFREKDKINLNNYDPSLVDSLKLGNSTQILINGAIEDDNGDYILNELDNYVYDPENNINGTRFNIEFSNDVNGEYIRSVNSKGRVFYEYQSSNKRDNSFDYYSPFKNIITPKSQDLLFITNKFNISSKSNFEMALLGSRNIENNVSLNRDSKLKGSYKIIFDAGEIDVGNFSFGLTILDWNKQDGFKTFGSDRDVEATRFWNYNFNTFNNQHEQKLDLNIDLNDISNTKIDFSRLAISNNNMKRFSIKHSIIEPRFQGSFFKMHDVNSLSKKYKFISSRFIFNSKVYSPFVSYEIENNYFDKKYTLIGSGINLNIRHGTISSGISKKSEILLDETNADNSIISDDYIGFLNLNILNLKGWSNNIVIKKRIKRTTNELAALDYALGKIKVKYFSKNSLLKFDLFIQTEESYFNNTYLAYDSVGVGLGEFRYDNTFNTYVLDPNGSYIAYRVLSDKQKEITKISGYHNLEIDFGKLKSWPNLIFYSNTKYNIHSNNFNISELLSPSFSDDIMFSKLSSWNSIELIPMRILSSIIISQNFRSELNEISQNNSEIFYEKEFEYNIVGKKVNSFKISNNSDFKNIKVVNSVSESRNRFVKGWVSQFHLFYYFFNNTEVDLTVSFGNDYGSFNGNTYDASINGFEISTMLFIGSNGRFNLESSYFNNEEVNGLINLPPESLNGMTTGENFSLSSSVQYLINNKTSIILNINNIRNNRYYDFLNISLEARAYF